MHTEFLVNEKVFLNRSVYEEAARHYSLKQTACDAACQAKHGVSAAACAAGESIKVSELLERIKNIELENKQLKEQIAQFMSQGGKPSTTTATAPAPKAAPAPAKAEDDDDVDLFGDEDEEESEEKKRITAERLAAYAAKKGNKPALIPKSSVLLDVKPWDDETDMKMLEESVRTIEMDGLVWGSSKLVPVAFNIKKLQIQCVIEDDKVSTEVLEEKICEFEDYVQSVDIAAFNKI
jgi:translation elongation factor EF-1beta/ribosomal protein L12E/L44/L45/RPP1/RPP2